MLAYREAEGEMLTIEQEIRCNYSRPGALQFQMDETGGRQRSIGMELPTIGTPTSFSRTRRAVVAALVESRAAPASGAPERLARLIERVLRDCGHAHASRPHPARGAPLSALQEANLVMLCRPDRRPPGTEASPDRAGGSAARARVTSVARLSLSCRGDAKSQIAELKKQAADMGLLADRLESIDHDMRGAS